MIYVCNCSYYVGLECIVFGVYYVVVFILWPKCDLLITLHE